MSHTDPAVITGNKKRKLSKDQPSSYGKPPKLQGEHGNTRARTSANKGLELERDLNRQLQSEALKPSGYTPDERRTEYLKKRGPGYTVGRPSE